MSDAMETGLAAGKRITRDDLMPMDAYAAERGRRRREMTELKRDRRLEVGPFCTFYFESHETMWHQVHEMLFIEKGGDEQIDDELAAYNPLIPQGRELVATIMFEIDDDVRRARVLARLGGVEETFELRFAGEVVRGDPEEDVDRTSAAGKASSVQFAHFRMTDAQAEKFKRAGAEVHVAVTHENYGHIAVMPEAVRGSLARDLD